MKEKEKKVKLNSLDTLLWLKGMNFEFIKKHLLFLHLKWRLKDIISCRKNDNIKKGKTTFCRQILSLFSHFFLYKKENPLILELDNITLQKKEREESISFLIEKIRNLEEHTVNLRDKEKEAFERFSSLGKVNESEGLDIQKKGEGLRWKANNSLRLIEKNLFDVFDILIQSTETLKGFREDILKFETREIELEEEIDRQNIIKRQKGESKGGIISISKKNEVPKSLFSQKQYIHFDDLFLLSMRTFKTKLAMTLMTILGIGVSFATIFFLVSLGYGLEKLLLDQFASPILMRSLDVTSLSPDAVPLNEQAKKNIAALPGVELTEPIFGISGQIEFDSLSSEVEFRGASPKYFELLVKNLKEGEIYKEGDRSILVSSLLIQTSGKTFADFSSNMVNITVYHHKTVDDIQTTEIIKLGSFKVAGVIDDPNNSFVYLPPDYIKDMVTQYSSLKVVAKDSGNISALRNSISNLGFATVSVLDTVDQATKVFGVLEVLLALFGIASLLVATIGMVNTMTVSLLQRTQEIGVMKVLGVDDSDVRKLFLLEAAIIGSLGGLSGILMGFIFSQAFNFGINLLAKNLGGQPVSLFYYPVWFITGVAFASFVIGIITGIVPAQRAAKMDPINAVKYK